MSQGSSVVERSPHKTLVGGSIPTPATKPDMAALRAIAGGKTMEMPEVEMCTYKEYDQDTGETMGCGLVKHSMKQRHGAWRRLST